MEVLVTREGDTEIPREEQKEQALHRQESSECPVLRASGFRKVNKTMSNNSNKSLRLFTASLWLQLLRDLLPRRSTPYPPVLSGPATSKEGNEEDYVGGDEEITSPPIWE